MTEHSDHCLHFLSQNLLIFQLRSEQSYRLILDAIEGRNLAKVDCFDIHLILLIDSDTLGFLEIFNCFFNQLRQEIVDVLGSAATQIVEVWIGRKSAIQKRPCHPIDCLLLGCDRAYDYLRIQTIV